LNIKTDRLQEASRLLQAKGWRVTNDGEDTLSVHADSEVDAAVVNRALVTAGMRVYELRRAPDTLEDLFLRLIAACEPAPVA